MNTQTSLVAEQIRLRQWTDQIRDCKNRPSNMKVDAWCREHGLTKANYYYRLRRVREAGLELYETSPSFVELTAPADDIQEKEAQFLWEQSAMLNDASGFQKIYLATGYTDYPRSIIIREDCCNQ